LYVLLLGRGGEVVWLMSQSAEFKEYLIADLEWLVMPAILLRQFRLFSAWDHNHPRSTGDFNNDGTDDLIWRSDAGGTELWKMLNGNNNGAINLGNTAGWEVLATGNFGSGHDDILWRHSNGHTMTWLLDMT
jgi:hypothetical protein